MKKGNSHFIRLMIAVMALVIGSSMAYAKNGIEQCSENPEYLFVVNGITGETVCAPENRIYYAPSTVIVRVAPVNLYAYSYKISPDSKEMVKRYPAVGLSASEDASKVGVESIGKIAGLLGAPTPFDLPIPPAEPKYEEIDSACSVANQYHSGEITFLTNSLIEINTGGSYVWRAGAENNLKGLQKTLESMKTELGKYEKWLKETKKEEELKKYQEEANRLRLNERLAFGVSVYKRWLSTIHNYQPQIEHTTVIRGGNYLYNININRKYVATIKDDGTVSSAVDPLDEIKIPFAAVAFESHSKSYLNFSLGYAGYFRTTKGYQSVLSIDDSGSKKAVIEEKNDAKIDVKPHLMLGVYLNGPVDEIDLKRGSKMILTMGMEAAKDPKEYSLGVAVDFPQGIVIGLGAVYYKDKKLAGGYKKGDKIPMDKEDKPLFSDIPVMDTDRFAPYISFTFRPSIIQSFLKLLPQ